MIAHTTDSGVRFRVVPISAFYHHNGHYIMKIRLDSIIKLIKNMYRREYHVLSMQGPHDISWGEFITNQVLMTQIQGPSPASSIHSHQNNHNAHLI